MIRRLKIKFVSLAMVVLFVLLAVVLMGMTVLNYNSVIHSADEILTVLSQNNGAFPTITIGSTITMSPETPYSSRYFWVYLTKSGVVLNINITNIASVNQSTAIEYASVVLSSNEERGFIDGYRYAICTERDGIRVIFLDCESRLEAFRSTVHTGLAVAGIGLVVVFFVVFFLSGRIIKPVAESYEKQKRFITDAGHEIKTPLTIINANADILEMELGDDNESIADIKTQTSRLRDLTEELILLARMEEAGGGISKIEFPVSEVVTEAAHPFTAIASRQGKSYYCDIQPMLTLNGDSKSISRLTSILLDNAMKYSPQGGSVAVRLVAQGKAVVLSVYNTTAEQITKEQLDHVFDRFYRSDGSRNSETGGHGIGLSVAKAIVTAHGGKIFANTRDGMSFEVTAIFT